MDQYQIYKLQVIFSFTNNLLHYWRKFGKTLEDSTPSYDVQIIFIKTG
jgi:hypothetical protein